MNLQILRSSHLGFLERFLVVFALEDKVAFVVDPCVEIVARVRWQEDAEALNRIGVHKVVWPEMEGGQQILRHSLLRYEVGIQEVDTLVAQLRTYEPTPENPEDEAGRSPGEQPEKQSAGEC